MDSVLLIKNSLRYFEELGFDQDLLCRMAGLDEKDLANPHHRIESKKMESIWEYILEQTGNENLGLFLGVKSSFAVLGILGNLIQNSPNIEIALKKACEFFLLYTDSIKMELQEKDEVFELIFFNDQQADYGHSPAQKQLLDSTMAFAFKEVEILIQKNDSPVRALFTYPQPEKTVDYQEVFRTECLFDQNRNALVFEKKLLQAAITFSDYHLLFHLEKYACHLLEKIEHEQSWAGKVKRTIMSQVRLSFPTLAQVSDILNVSSRNLQRKLKEENTSYKDLLSGLRKEMATNYLKTTDLSIAEISYILGYNEPNSFIRAFKSWFKTTPKNYQKTHNPTKG